MDLSHNQPPPAALALWLILALVALLDNFRRSSDPAGLAKVKWILWGLTVAVASFTLWAFAEAIPRAAMLLGAMTFPMSLAIAVVRHRLFDIDLIIRRTVVYTAVSALLAGMYLGSVAGKRLLDWGG